MRERLLVIVAAVALLVAAGLPGMFSAPILPNLRTGGQQVVLEQVARAIVHAQCQSNHGCGG